MWKIFWEKSLEDQFQNRSALWAYDWKTKQLQLDENWAVITVPWAWWNWVVSWLTSDSWWRPKMVQDFSLFHWMFTFDITEKHWIVDDDWVEQGRTEDSIRVLQKEWGANINSWSSIWQSWVLRGKRHPRYQPNRGILFSTAWFIPNSTTLWGIRRWGLATEENWIFFELSEDAKLYAVRRKSTHQEIIATNWQTVFTFTTWDILSTSAVFARVKLATWIEYSNYTNFTIDDSANTLTFDAGFAVNDEVTIVVVDDYKEEILEQNLRNIWLVNWISDLQFWALYDIQAQWRGQWDYFFFINQKLVYKFENLWKLKTTSISNHALPIRFESKNISNEWQNFDLFIWCADLTSEGWNVDRLDYVSVTNWADSVECDTTWETVIISWYIPPYFKWRHTTRDFHLVRIIGSAFDERSLLRVFVTKDPTALLNPTALLERNQGSSLLYYKNDVAGTMKVDLAKVQEVATFAIPINDTRNLTKPAEEIHFLLTHWDYVIIVWQCNKQSQTSLMSVTMEFWEEV